MITACLLSEALVSFLSLTEIIRISIGFTEVLLPLNVTIYVKKRMVVGSLHVGIEAP